MCRRGRVGLPGCPEGVSKEASASGLLSRLPPAPPSPEECGAGPPGSCCPRGRAAPAEGTSRTWKRREVHSARRPQLLTGTQQVRGLAGLRPTHESRTCDASTPAPPFPSAWVKSRLPEEQSDEVAILRGSRNKSKVKFAGVFSHAHHVLPRERQVSCPARGKEVVPRSRTQGGCVLTAERAPPPATARSAGA